MKQTRARLQRGSLYLSKRADGNHVWLWRVRKKDESGKIVRPGIPIGTIKEFQTASKAWEECDRRRMAEQTSFATSVATFGDVIKRYEADQDELPPAFSSRKGNTSYLKVHIKPQWGKMPINLVTPLAMKQWFKTLKLAGKTKGNIKGLMHRLFECALLWEYLEGEKNPVELVHLRGVSKRKNRKQRILTAKELWLIFNQLEDPWRTAAISQFCLGLRLSELMALKWCDFDWLSGQIHICRRNIDNRIEETTKSEASNDDLPLHAQVAELFRRWREKTLFKADTDFVFASPHLAGEKPYFPSSVLHKLKCAAQRAKVASVGTHTLRHTYRAWLDETGAPIGVQQKLMRHADVRTTMEYGDAFAETKRAVNSQVVEKAFAVM